MKKNILYITNFSSKEDRSPAITNFSYAVYKAATNNKIEFHINTNRIETVSNSIDSSVHTHLIEVYRNPFSKETLIAYKQLMKVLSIGHFDAIYCNTPIGGVLGRICGKKKRTQKIIYQAHGFHFYKGAPLLNWLVYYPIERWLAKYTDILITINNEDYECAKKFKLKKNGKVCYVPGVGIDLSEFNNLNIDKNKKRSELGFNNEDFLCIGIGRIDANKNFGPIIKAISKLESRIHLLICGTGDKKEELENLVTSLKLQDRVHFLGYRSDIKELLSISDCFVSSSLREGLPRALMEAMACGTPCIVSKIRGNVDLIENKINGICVDANNIYGYAEAINLLSVDMELVQQIKKNSQKKLNEFSLENVVERLDGILSNMFSDL